MEHSYRKINKLRTLICILSIVSLFLLTGMIYQTASAKTLSQQAENKYMSAFYDLCDYLDDIDVLIEKTMLSSSPKQIASTATQIYMQTASAKICLSQLPLSDINLDKTSKFLVQAGDYASFLSAKSVNGEEISDKEFENLSVLSKHAKKISSLMENTREKIYNGTLSFVKSKKEIAHAEDEENSITKDFSALENEFIEYPSLIYDGPFSDHIITQESSFLKFKGQVTDTMALRSASEILGKDRAEGLSLEDEGSGAIETYIFKKESKERTLSVAITKQGARLLWMLDNREVKSEQISIEKAQSLAKDFLQKAGYENMKESYFDKSGNVATLNFAFTQNGITIYPDLVKVNVALDNGEILGIEANGYLMNHKNRTVPDDIIDENTAKTRIRKHLDISDVSLAVIPVLRGREVLCYELKGAFDDRNFLIYINAQTGEDERILMLEESAEGILTV